MSVIVHMLFVTNAHILIENEANKEGCDQNVAASYRIAKLSTASKLPLALTKMPEFGYAQDLFVADVMKETKKK